MQRGGTTILPVNGGRADHWANKIAGFRDEWEKRGASQSPNRKDRHALKKM